MRQDLVDALASADARTRARAAKRVVATRDAAYVPALLHAAARNDTDLPLIVDALGRTGDARALPLARALAEKKLLSRRRAGVEALRALGDGEGLETARARGRERLGPLAATLDATAVTGDIDALVAALRATPRIKRGDALDTCYELSDAFVTIAVHAVLRDEDIHVPHMLRYTKSILKRALLRDDAPMLGLLAYRIDLAARAFRSTRAELKSGLDGVKRPTRVFGARTSSYLRRAILRHLRTLARHSPEKLAPVVAEILVHYRRADAELPRGLRGPWGRLLVLSTIVYGADDTLVFDPHTRWVRARDAQAVDAARAPSSRLPVAALREDHGALARLFRDAEAPPVLDFVVALVGDDHARLVRVRGLDAARRIDCGHAGIERLAEAIVLARHREAAADVQVIGTLLSAKSERGRALGVRLLDDAFPVIVRDAKALGALFGVSAARDVLGARVERGDLDASSRDVLTRALLGALEHSDGDVRAFAAQMLVTRLADDVRHIVDRSSALALARDENEAKVTVAAFILADIPEAHRELGLERVGALARSSSLVLRGFALTILAHADVQRDDVVAAWVAVAEGDFADASARAREVLRGLSCLTADTFPLVMRLVDSTTAAVRTVGIEKLTASAGVFATDRTLVMLAEHPDRDVRAYAVGLAAEHLREGLVPLLGIEALVRATLGETLPDARAKRTLLELLAERATRDEGQAEVIARWLAPYVRTRTVRDRERIVSVLGRIEAAFPGVVTPLSVTA